jgi:GDP-L-fucose synthase
MSEGNSLNRLIPSRKLLTSNVRIFVAGHKGLVGSALIRALKVANCNNIIVADKQNLDLTNQSKTEDFFRKQSIDLVFVAAAKVGGIISNSTYQADFLYQNLMIAANVINSAANNGVEKLLFLGSSCIYPRLAAQPISESSLLTGSLEPTNEGYAIAKIAGLKLCEKYQSQLGKRFISAMPTNLYGPNDNFHPNYSHVIPGLIRRFHEAKINNSPSVEIWGTGNPRREFLYVDDLAQALLLIMEEYEDLTTINVGCGMDISIRELAESVKECVGYKGNLNFDTTKPDGAPRKLLDISKLLSLGWTPSVTIKDGLEASYKWACKNNIFINSTENNAVAAN